MTIGGGSSGNITVSGESWGGGCPIHHQPLPCPFCQTGQWVTGAPALPPNAAPTHGDFMALTAAINALASAILANSTAQANSTAAANANTAATNSNNLSVDYLTAALQKFLGSYGSMKYGEGPYGG